MLGGLLFCFLLLLFFQSVNRRCEEMNVGGNGMFLVEKGSKMLFQVHLGYYSPVGSLVYH